RCATGAVAAVWRRAFDLHLAAPEARSVNRRSLFFTTTALALATLGAGTARAQGVDEFGAYGDTSPASDQYLALEVRFGPYLPNVDDEFSDAAPFEETFG